MALAAPWPVRQVASNHITCGDFLGVHDHSPKEAGLLLIL
jgi:hypothetical protein